MSAKIPIGHLESQRLEFKGRDSLRHLSSIGREVVAMLNSGGGDLWIGLAEDNGRAVKIEGIENAQREVGRVRDHLADSIEPSPAPGEFTVEAVPTESDETILRARVRPQGRARRYSHREGTARHFLKRVDDRVRPMSHEEIFGRTEGDPLEDAKRRLRQAREALQAQKPELLWLRIQPVGDLELTLTRDLREYFVDPTRTGNRLGGWNFIIPYAETRLEGSKLVHGDEKHLWTSVSANGTIELTLALPGLYWKSTGEQVEGQAANEIWPFCLLEYPISVFRLASTLYRERASMSVESVLGDLALFGLRGWKLRPHSPNSIGHMLLRRPKPFSEPDLIWDDPLTFAWDELIDQPDRCGYRLVQRVYAAFGFYEDEMPKEFDRQAGQLRFPKA